MQLLGHILKSALATHCYIPHGQKLVIYRSGKKAFKNTLLTNNWHLYSDPCDIDTKTASIILTQRNVPPQNKQIVMTPHPSSIDGDQLVALGGLVFVRHKHESDNYARFKYT